MSQIGLERSIFRETMFLVNTSDSEDNCELDPRRPDDFAELVRLHHRDLLVYGQSLCRDVSTSADIVQESFVVAFEKVHTFDVTKDFASWMRGIVRNKWREWVRKNKRYDLSDNELAHLDADIASWQASRANESSTLFDALEIGLDRLPENLRETVKAFYYEGRSGEEVSEILQIEPAAVRKRLQRARVLLKEFLDHRLSEDRNTPPNKF